MMRTILSALATTAILAMPAAADPTWRVLAQFDDAPEGLVADGAGGLFVSMFSSARVLRVAADGTSTQIATLRDVIGDAEGSTIGLDWDGADTIYVAFAEHSHRYPLSLIHI